MDKRELSFAFNPLLTRAQKIKISRIALTDFYWF